MSTSIETLTAQLQQLQNSVIESITTLNSELEKYKQEQQLKDDVLAPFNAFLTVELTPYFGAKESLAIVEKLKRCRTLSDYRYFCPMYKLAGDDLKKRQLLKLISATYRYKFGGHRSSEKYSLKSEIKYAKACDECGQLASTLYNRLVKEGLWA